MGIYIQQLDTDGFQQSLTIKGNNDSDVHVGPVRGVAGPVPMACISIDLTHNPPAFDNYPFMDKVKAGVAVASSVANIGVAVTKILHGG